MEGPPPHAGDVPKTSSTPSMGVAGASPDEMNPIVCLPDALQVAGGGSLPVGSGDAYAPLSMGAPLPQRAVSPALATDFSQVMKLSEGVSPMHMGMMGFTACMPKTPPKPVVAPPRHIQDSCGITHDLQQGRPEDAPGRMNQTPQPPGTPLVSSPGGLATRCGCGSAGSSTVSSSAGSRGGVAGRPGASTPASRSSIVRRLSTPPSRPLPVLGGLLGNASFHTEYREQMSPSWWLGAAACSSSWLQLSPPPEVMELVEKKKLTEQFKTDYLGALRLQADRRNVLHLLALDEQEMQMYLWQPRFPRIIDLRNRSEQVQTRPPPRHTNCLIDPKQLWLRFLAISPPIYSTEMPVPAVSPKTPQSNEGLKNEQALFDRQGKTEPQEYLLGTTGEQFLPILIEDSGGVAECVAPEDLLMFEEEALREVSWHLEAKLTQALTCMVLAAKARSNASTRALGALGAFGNLGAPPGSPGDSGAPGALGASAAPSKDEEAAPDAGEGKDNKLSGTSPSGAGSSPRASGTKRRRSSMEEQSSSDSSSFRTTNTTADQGPCALEVGSKESGLADGPTATGPAGNASRERDQGTGTEKVVLRLEDVVAAFGPAPSLLRSEHCILQPASDARQLYR